MTIEHTREMINIIKNMKHLHTFSSFLNEASTKKSMNDIAREMVEIAAGFTEVDLTLYMSQAQKIDNASKLMVFYNDLLDYVAEEGEVSQQGLRIFKKDIDSFLKYNDIKI